MNIESYLRTAIEIFAGSDMKTSKLFTAMAALLIMGSSCWDVFAGDNRVPVAVSADSKVPLRILTRPGAVLYADAEGTKVLKSNVPTFSSYFVYTRPKGEAAASGEGWYEIGSDDRGSVKGWMKGNDLFEWKQTMCLTFSHPDGRSPVLMFDDEDILNTLIGMSEDDRTAKVDGYYSDIDQAAAGKKKLSRDFPVLSVEPKMAVDNADNFTLMPIVDYKVVEFEGRESRLLDIVAVNSTEKDRKASDIRENKEYLTASNATSESKSKDLKDMKYDIVWVVDTTRSMGPYIEKVREIMNRVSGEIAKNKSFGDKVAFGVWGYRDSATIEGLEYVTNNFTPELQNAQDFAETIGKVKETKVDSVTFDEDMFSGVNDAVKNTAWRNNTTRIIIVVGDAPGHQEDHEWNITGLNQENMRHLADDNGITLFAIHIKPNKTKKFNKIAATQFKTLSQNPGVSDSLYWDITASDMKSFENVAAMITERTLNYLASAESSFTGKQVDTVSIMKDDAQNVKGPSADVINQALHAAAVTWLGNEADVAPPRDIEAWVSDKDLKDSTRQSLEVQLLLTKAQLDAISTLLKEVLVAGETNQVSGDDFFTSLQAASAVAARDPDKLAKAGNIAESGLVPDFLKNLPYKSRLMEMNNEVWESWGPDEQNAFLSNLESKIKAYGEIHDNTAKWISLNEGDDADDYVAPIPLDLMP